MIRNSPLRLKELFFPQVAVKALVPKAAETALRELDLNDLEISFGFDFDETGKDASAGVKIATKGKAADATDENVLYQVRIEAFANFEVMSPEHTDALAVYLRKFAAAAALIGAAREQIALMTARGPWGVVMLPIISMDRVVGPPPPKTVELPPNEAKKASPRKKPSTALPRSR